MKHPNRKKPANRSGELARAFFHDLEQVARERAVSKLFQTTDTVRANYLKINRDA